MNNGIKIRLAWASVGLVLIILACAYGFVTSNNTPTLVIPVEEYPFNPTAESVIMRADFDGDGILDSYCIRSEKCTKYTMTCTGRYAETVKPQTYENSVVIMKGGSNLSTLLWGPIIWSSKEEIDTGAWTKTCELAVKINKEWQRIPGTMAQGRLELSSGETMRGCWGNGKRE